MQECQKCQAKLKENSKFCEKCGTKVEAKPTQSKNPEKKSGSKLQKVLIVGAASLVLLSVIGYNVGSSVYSRENQMSDLVDVLASKDAEALAKVMESDDPNFEVSAESLEPFIAYLDQNPNYLSQMARELEIYGEYDSVRIRKNGSRFGLYDAYDLFISPIYATVTTNTEGAVISTQENSLITANEEQFSREVGPFAPGIHTFTAEGEINGHTLTTSEEITLISDEYYNEIDLALTGSYVSIESDLNDATVYLNDESVGELVNGYAEIGPFQWEEGMTTYVSKSFGDDEIVSEKEELYEGHSYLSFNGLSIADEYDLSQVLSGMYNTMENLTRWYYTDDFERLESAFHPDGPAFKKQKDEYIAFVGNMYDNEEVSSVRFDVSINNYEQVSATAFEVDYEVTYRTTYTWQADKINSMKHYGKEATIVYEPTNNPDKDYDVFIYDIRNEELMYEE